MKRRTGTAGGTVEGYPLPVAKGGDTGNVPRREPAAAARATAAEMDRDPAEIRQRWLKRVDQLGRTDADGRMRIRTDRRTRRRTAVGQETDFGSERHRSDRNDEEERREY